MPSQFSPLNENSAVQRHGAVWTAQHEDIVPYLKDEHYFGSKVMCGASQPAVADGPVLVKRDDVMVN
jgi:hypothetical protein